MRLSLPLIAILSACAGDTEEQDDPRLTAPVVATDPGETASSTLNVEPRIEVESTGADGIEYTYSWLSDAGLSWNQTVLPATATRRGETWTVTAVPHAADLTGPSGSASIAITNGAPSIEGASFSPATPTIGVALQCVPDGAVDPDEDALTYTYRWSIDSTDIGLNADTLPAQQVVASTDITCGIIASDGELSSAEVTVTDSADNSPPTVASAAITPGSPISTEDLTCVATGGTDPDGDLVVFTYGWTVNGTDQNEASDTLAAASYVRGDSVICTAYPSDGVATGAGVDSSPVLIGNAPPTVSLVSLSPVDPLATDTLACQVTADDPDNDQLTNTYRWFVNGLEQAETSDLLAPGVFTNQDNIACEATVSDGLATASGTSLTVVVGNTPPVVTGVTISPDPADATNSLTCSHGGTNDAEGDPVSVSYAWTVEGVAAGSGSTLAPGTAIRDQTVQCLATPNDGLVDGAPATASIVLVNSPPGVPQLTATPTTPTSADDIVCAASADDPDGDTLTWTYEWYIGTTLVGSAATLPAGTVTSQEVARCEATPNDGQADGPTGSLFIALGNQLPVITSVQIGPSDPVAGDTMTCTPTASDPDNDTLTYSYVWLVNNVDVGVDSNELTPSQQGLVYSDNVQCVVTVSDAISGVSSSSNTVVVLNTAPTLASASISPSQADTTRALTCSSSGAADVDAQSVNVTYAWTVAGSAAGTGSGLSAGVAVKGDTAICTATPDDGVDNGTARTASLVIGNAAPGTPSVQVGPGGATGADQLSCLAAASDPDNDSLNYTYTWYVGSTQVGTGSTLSSGTVSRDDVVRCEATATDGTATGPAGSASLTIGNQPPVISSVTLSDYTPQSTDSVTCSVSASDDDQDSLTITRAWFVNSTPVGGNTTSLSGVFAYGDTIQCRATVTDGVASPALTSSTATVQNTLPSVSGVSISPTNGVDTTQALTCSYSSLSDPDVGQNLTATYSWTIGGTVVSTAATLPAYTAAKGQTAICAVTPYDTVQTGTARTASKSIGNAPPNTPSVTITPNPATTADNLSCAASATDPDNETPTYNYTWYAGPVTIGSGSSLPADSVTAGTSVRCEATAFDGTDTGPVGSASITLSAPPNSPPTIDSVSLTPTTAYEMSYVLCTPNGVDDADGDNVTLTYAWTNGGQTIIGENGIDLDRSNFAKDDIIACQVTPNDGNVNGTTTSSNEITIRNSKPTLNGASMDLNTLFEASRVTCVPSSYADNDGDQVTLEYRWTVNGTTVSTGTTLDGRAFDRLDDVRCHITPFDGDEYGLEMNSSTITVKNTPPNPPKLSLFPGIAGEDLTCQIDVAEDDDPADMPLEQFEFQWFINGNPWTGITLDRYYPGDTLMSRDVRNGYDYTCEVRATDNYGATGLPGSRSIFIDGGIIPQRPLLTGRTPSRGVQLRGYRLGLTDMLSVDSSVSPDCDIEYVVNEYTPATDRWAPIWTVRTQQTEVELLGAFEITDDGKYSVEVRTSGCDEELFEVALDGEWRTARAR